MTIKIKFLIAKMVTNSFVGFVLRNLFFNKIRDLRWLRFRFDVSFSIVTNKTVASIFFGIYEASEKRLIQRYLKADLDVVELGSSMGLVSTHILSRLSSKRKLICVEANPYLIDVIKANLRLNDKGKHTVVVENVAINYSGVLVNLHLTDNTTETKVSLVKNSGVEVNAVSLRSILSEQRIKDYTLVCDIEGSEIEVFKNDASALSMCRDLFIELHETKFEELFYSVNDLVELIKSHHGFELVDRDGPVCFFSKKN